MLTWGLLVIIVNVVYLLFAWFIGYLAYKFFKDKYRHIGKIVFIVVLLAPFWDLIIQKSVKTYYQAFKMEGEIYAYPEVDAEGKIESLDMTNKLEHRTIFRLVSYLDFKYKEMTFENFGIEKFKIDSLIKDTDSNEEEKKLRVRFDDVKPQFEYIENGSARYKIDGESERFLFGLYTQGTYLLIDNKTNKILAKDISVSFSSENENKFRNKYLLWISGNGIPFNISQIKSSVIKEKVLKINYL